MPQGARRLRTVKPACKRYADRLDLHPTAL